MTGQDLIAGVILGLWVLLLAVGLLFVASFAKAAAVTLIVGFGLGVVWPVVVLPPAWIVCKLMPVTGRRWFPFFFEDEP